MKLESICPLTTNSSSSLFVFTGTQAESFLNLVDNHDLVTTIRDEHDLLVRFDDLNDLVYYLNIQLPREVDLNQKLSHSLIRDLGLNINYPIVYLRSEWSVGWDELFSKYCVYL